MCVRTSGRKSCTRKEKKTLLSNVKRKARAIFPGSLDKSERNDHNVSIHRQTAHPNIESQQQPVTISQTLPFLTKNLIKKKKVQGHDLPVSKRQSNFETRKKKKKCTPATFCCCIMDKFHGKATETDWTSRNSKTQLAKWGGDYTHTKNERKIRSNARDLPPGRGVKVTARRTQVDTVRLYTQINIEWWGRPPLYSR